MNAMRYKLIIAGAALLSAVGFLAFSGVREGWVYYLPVDQFVANSSYSEQRVRLHGVVAAENLQIDTAAMQASFDLKGEQSALRVVYSGIIPDTFQAGREVVVEGQSNEHGLFRADTLLTKCASKYESAEGESPHQDPSAKAASS